jgi:hypothetical protein
MVPSERDATLGRSGLLAHSYLLGPNGDSSGFVSIKNYEWSPLGGAGSCHGGRVILFSFPLKTLLVRLECRYPFLAKLFGKVDGQA